MNILYIGDTVGNAGRSIVKHYLKELQQEHHIDVTILNCENAAGGFGITPKIADEFLDWGIDALTSGNHIWDKKEIIPYLAGVSNGRLLRPANFPAQAPGSGLFLGKTSAGVPYAVLNLQGRIFMASIDCPFRTADALLAQIPADVRIRIVDAHAEATSEKLSLGWYLDGRVTAVVGTHTHVPTADEKILPKGSAYITDVGMSGPYDSVIGMEKEAVIRKFLDQMPARFEVAKGDVRLCGALIEANPADGRALSIQRIMRR